MQITSDSYTTDIKSSTACKQRLHSGITYLSAHSGLLTLCASDIARSWLANHSSSDHQTTTEDGEADVEAHYIVLFSLLSFPFSFPLSLWEGGLCLVLAAHQLAWSLPSCLELIS